MKCHKFYFMRRNDYNGDDMTYGDNETDDFNEGGWTRLARSWLFKFIYIMLAVLLDLFFKKTFV